MIHATGNLYFVQEGPCGAIKIGWTQADPLGRLTSMQTGNSDELQLIAVIPNQPYAAEGQWHERFSGQRKRAEWFYPTPSLLQEIAAAGRDGSPSMFARRGEATRAAVDQWLERNNVSWAQLAQRMGMRIVTIKDGLRFGMSARMAERLDRATDGAIPASVSA